MQKVSEVFLHSATGRYLFRLSLFCIVITTKTLEKDENLLEIDKKTAFCCMMAQFVVRWPARSWIVGRGHGFEPVITFFCGKYHGA